MSERFVRLDGALWTPPNGDWPGSVYLPVSSVTSVWHGRFTIVSTADNSFHTGDEDEARRVTREIVGRWRFKRLPVANEPSEESTDA